LRAFGSRPLREGGVHSTEELKLMVTASRRVGLLPPLQEETIHRTLELGDVTVREIMVPRPDIFSLAADLPLDQALARVIEEQHSRIPVYDPARGPEHIIGVLYAKELMRWQQLRAGKPGVPSAAPLPHVTVRNLMRTVLFVPETKPVIDLLVDFKTNRRHLAVVVDEFGSIAGVVTVEDVLDQIVGEIEDEFDVTPPRPAALGGTLVLEGSTTILDLETQYRLALPRNQGFETLAGFVLSRLQRIPAVGDSFVHDGRRFTVLALEGRRIARVKLETVQTPKPREERVKAG